MNGSMQSESPSCRMLPILSNLGKYKRQSFKKSVYNGLDLVDIVFFSFFFCFSTIGERDIEVDVIICADMNRRLG